MRFFYFLVVNFASFTAKDKNSFTFVIFKFFISLLIYCVAISCFDIVTENGATDGTVASKDGVAEKNVTQKDQVRTNFQQMISTAVSNAQQQNGEYAATATVTNHRRRIGSGRIPDQNFTAPDNSHAIGLDVRYMRNKLFKDDGKIVKNWKSGKDWFTKWNHADMATQASDIDNADAKSDEPEWANCGPIS